MERDFTFIDDVLRGVIAAIERHPAGAGEQRLYNIGNHRPERLLQFISVLERAIGRTATKEWLPMQPGDVQSTYADVEPARRDLGYDPRIPIEVGLPLFVSWYKQYHGHAENPQSRPI